MEPVRDWREAGSSFLAHVIGRLSPWHGADSFGDTLYLQGLRSLNDLAVVLRRRVMEGRWSRGDSDMLGDYIKCVGPDGVSLRIIEEYHGSDLPWPYMEFEVDLCDLPQDQRARRCEAGVRWIVERVLPVLEPSAVRWD